VSNHAPAEADDQYMAVQATPEFQALRKKFRGFVFPATAFFLAWYFLYVLLSIFALGLHEQGPSSGNVSRSGWSSDCCSS
jgi:uncharacterized membrane protein (DUF485 family)